MSKKITNIATNVIMGFLGVGKTTAIINLLQQKPKHQKWAVLVNEFGKVGIDGAILNQTDAIIKEIPGGCLCCAAGVPFQVSLNRLIKDVNPDRLLIEPTGLGHPKKVLDRLTDNSYQDVLDLRASICLVDPEKLKDKRYTQHKNFIDQMALSDILIANKTDLADDQGMTLFQQQAQVYTPAKQLIAQTVQGQINSDWLDYPRNSNRIAEFPNNHSITKLTPIPTNTKESIADGYQSYGHIFPPEDCFDYTLLTNYLNQLTLERMKGVFFTNQGWFIANHSDGITQFKAVDKNSNSQFEVIAQQGQLQNITQALKQCRIDNTNIHRY